MVVDINARPVVSAMTYDRMANAIGPFEVSEYLGLVLVYGALAVTAPFPRSGTASSIDELNLPLQESQLRRSPQERVRRRLSSRES